MKTLILLLCLIPTMLSAQGFQLIQKGWSYQFDSTGEWIQSDTPCNMQAPEGAKKITLERSIPSSMRFNSLFISGMPRPFSVYFDSEKVYSFSPTNKSGFKAHFIELPSHNHQNLRLEADIISGYPAGFCNKMYLGNNIELPKFLLFNSFPVLLCAFFLMISCIALFIGFFAYQIPKRYLIYGFLALNVGVWIFSTPENQIKAWIFNDSFLWVIIDQTSLYFLPYVFTVFLNTMIKNKVMSFMYKTRWFYLLFSAVALFSVMFLGVSYTYFHKVFNLIIPAWLILFLVSSIIYLLKDYKNLFNIIIGLSAVNIICFAAFDWYYGAHLKVWHNLTLPFAFCGSTLFMSFALFYDGISKKKKVESIKLKNHTNQAIINTAEMIAHDIKNPFSKLESYIEIVDPDSTSPIFKNLKKELKSDITNINHMLEDVLDYSLKRSSINQSLNLSREIHKAKNDAISISKRDDVKITLNLDQDVYIQFDKVKLHRVILNILLNALQCMGVNHEIVIESKFVKNKLCVSFKNTGSSISKENLRGIFEPGFSTKEHGNGVGLAIVKKFIDESNSDISCVSDENSVTFQIIFNSFDKLLDVSSGSWNF